MSHSSPSPIFIHEAFSPRPLPRWRLLMQGTGQHVLTDNGLRLSVPGTPNTHYSNAQLDDATTSWQPPLTLTVRARLNGPFGGTAGFGFWNNPLTDGIRLPSAVWFFHAAPPSNMPLAYGVPGHGWKCATIDAGAPSALALAPLALPVTLLNNVPLLQRHIWPPIQRWLRIAEHPITPPMHEWATFQINWHHRHVSFIINRMPVFTTTTAPRGPLGFVAWVDNQWMRVDPRGRFGWGLSALAPQSLDLATLTIQKGNHP